jgi:hypothetical protein
MPLRKLAGFSKSGKVWVNPNLPVEVQARIRRHEKTYQRVLEQGKSRTEAIKVARKEEHRGLSHHGVMVYEGKVGALTKQLHGRMSYSPLRNHR